jgi:phosphatidylglycerophosphate synthase
MIWGIFGVINALVAAFILYRMRKGSMNLQEQFALGKAAVGVTLGIAILILMNALWHPTLENLAWGLFGVTGLVLAATIAIHNRVMAAELDSREHTLQLEYRLAELLDKLSGRP